MNVTVWGDLELSDRVFQHIRKVHIRLEKEAYLEPSASRKHWGDGVHCYNE